MRQSVRVDAGPTSVEVRTPAAHVSTIAGGCALVLVGVSMMAALRPVSAFSVALGFGSAVVGLWLVMSAGRAHLLLTDDELVQRGDLRRRVIRTEQINEFYVDRTHHVVPWFSVWVRLRSGEERALEQCRVFEIRRGEAHQRLQHAVDALNGRLMGG